MNFSSCWFKNCSRTLKLAYCYHYCDLSSKNYPIDNLQQYVVMWALLDTEIVIHIIKVFVLVHYEVKYFEKIILHKNLCYWSFPSL